MCDLKPIIFYLDDEEVQRKDLEDDLKVIFGEEYSIVGLTLRSNVNEYVQDFENPKVTGAFIDQRLNTTGIATTYNGVELCAYLRTMFPTLPIYLVTGQPIEGDLVGEKSGAAEAVVKKISLTADSDASKCVRQRFLRHASRHQESLTQDQQRYRELLRKVLNGSVTLEEETEYNRLQDNRLLGTMVSEGPSSEQLDKQISQFEKLLNKLNTL